MFLGVSILHSGLGVKINICLDLKLWLKPFKTFFKYLISVHMATSLLKSYKFVLKLMENMSLSITEAKSSLDLFRFWAFLDIFGQFFLLRAEFGNDS